MLINELIIQEDSSWPLWATIISKGLEKGRKFYFSSGANRIVNIVPSKAAGTPMFVLYLEHVKRKKNGNPDRQTYTVWEKVFDGLTLKKYEDGHRLVFRNSINEDLDEPLWVSILEKGKNKGHKFYFTLATDAEITDFEKMYDKQGKLDAVVLYLKFLGTNQTTMYTIWVDLAGSSKFHPGTNLPSYTFKKFKDGHKLQEQQKLEEAVSDPIVVSMFQKLIDNGQKVYFMNRAGKFTPVNDVTVGRTAGGLLGWWFYAPGARPDAIVWKTEKSINKLHLKKLDIDGENKWVLYDKTAVKLNEEMEKHKEPFIVLMINKRIKKMGAVRVDIPTLPIGKHLRGWLTDAPEHWPSAGLFGSRDGWKLRVRKDNGGIGVMWLYDDADSQYTLKKGVDGNGNIYLKMVEREAE